jgi:sugar phosphate isomerase/epimerase
VHERVSVNSLAFMGSPLDEVAGYWRELQPRRVSFIGPHLEDVEAARRVVHEGNYQVETIFHPLTSAGLSGMIATASSLGAHSIYGLTGGHGAGTWEESAAAFARAMAPSVEEAKEAGVALLIENAAILYADSHIAHNLTDLVTCAESAGIGILIDIFGIWSESSLKVKLERAMPVCGLVQVSDYVAGDKSFPCRAVPGDGMIPLERIIGWILEAGYTGGFDLELIGPRIDAEGRLEATRRAGDNLSAILDSLGA